MKVIFLDIDGVLNSTNDHKAIFKITGKPTFMGPPKLQPGEQFTRENLNWGKRKTEWIHGICSRTGCDIVISSTWRLTFPFAYQYTEMFRAYGWSAPVINTIPVTGGTRGDDIEAFINQSGFEGNYVILDDGSDFTLEQKANLVQTDRNVGLTVDDARRAIDILNWEE